MKPIKDQLEEKLPWLFSELGFRTVSDSYDPEHFGNSLAVLESDAFRLRFVRDRGLVDLQVAALSQPDDWWDFKFTCEAVFGERPEPLLEGYGPLIRRNLAGLAEALGPKLAETKKVIERQTAERKKKIEDYYSQRQPSETAIGHLLSKPANC